MGAWSDSGAYGWIIADADPYDVFLGVKSNRGHVNRKKINRIDSRNQ